jgi:RNA polymerase sigma factor (sigma-70 family)
MATGRAGGLIGHLRRGALRRGGAALSDGELLEWFLHKRDEAAFEALVRRHGPLVRGVCRRVLRNQHDADDAFQATFLVLLRKAPSIARRERLANWLYGVAYRTAREAKTAAARRRLKEGRAAARPQPRGEDAAGREVLALVDHELSRLPDKYRLPIVLCELQGKTYREAAHDLGWPEGTLAGRLSRARAALARRLERRGVALAGGPLAAALAPGGAPAGVPAPLVVSTARAATQVAAADAAAGLVPAQVAVLTEGVLKAMFWTKLKVAALVLLTAGAAGAGVAFLGHAAAAGPGAAPAEGRANDEPRQGPPKEADRPKGSVRIEFKYDRRKEAEAKLRAPITVNFKDAPLSQVLDDLRTFTGLNIVIDQPALEQDGLSADRPVTLRLENVALRTALTLLLRNVRMCYSVQDGIILVTTAAAARKPVMQVYQVADLLPAGQEKSADLLMKIITDVVDPASWSSVGGAGTIDFFPLTMTLVVSQPAEIQERVGALLDGMRALRETPPRKR